MSKGSINFSKDNEYYTPKYVVDYFGKFDYDPATTEEKAKDLNIPYYDTIDTDGLRKSKTWVLYNRIWCNPPFTIKHKFLEKAVETYKQNNNIEIYMLLPIEFLTTKRFYNITETICCKIFIPKGRIKFESGLNKESKSPAFGSVIIKLQNKWEIEMIEL